MRAIRFVPFEAAHLERFSPGRFDRVVLDDPFVQVLRIHWPGRAVSAERDERILGIAGAAIVAGCAWPWMALSDEMRRDFPVLLTRLARRAMGELFDIDGVGQVAVTADGRFDASCRWLESLGFRPIGFHDNKVRYSKMSGTELLWAAAANEAISSVSKAQQARAQSKAARWEAEIAQRQATYQRSLADAEAARVRGDSDRLLGRQIAAFAAAGFDPASSSALLAQQSLASEAEMEALQIRNGGRVRAASLDRSAALALSRARAAGQQQLSGFGTRLLTSQF